ncbi:MAG: Wzz/FepE/Etk N-terminal domain-containing protein [Parvibaculaceae bacterium]|nr:Wzz/FepE/Etk N-terminal domain-containing protein [Parvibaculaceae bacterium]
MPYGSDLQPYPRVDPAIEGASGGLDGVFSPGGLVDFFRILRRRRAIIFSVIILITLGALAATFGVTRQYTASASLLMSPQKLQVVDVQSVLSDLTTDSSTTESQLQVLQSRTLLEGVVTQLNLTQDPEFNTTLVPASPYRWLNPLTWLAKILPAPAPRSEEDQKAHELNVVINNLQGGLSISRVGVSYVMNVSFTSQDAKKAAVIANTICDRYLTDQLEAKFDATQKANDWLSQRLDSLRQQVEASDRAVEIYRSSNDLSATGPDGQYDK